MIEISGKTLACLHALRGMMVNTRHFIALDCPFSKAEKEIEKAIEMLDHCIRLIEQDVLDNSKG